ncbi:hypothetical protein [Aureispira anguillae]|uniref:Magnesium citrate secondary transporter n=1 Tax=Aureispira anguillae TaxID=2864201 RepID=A0A915YFM9_9BACT|nr:hypothetical protein [Aureispira anguillae]BDS12253.1 hypothetical protein AsAng_0029720 [Aureispira anguillae]
MGVLQNKVWQVCLLLFIGHQLTQKVLLWSIPLADNYLDTLLCMPILLGLILMERRFLWRRIKVYNFPLLDTIVSVAALAILYEEIFPVFFSGFTRDVWDYVSYALGACLFYFFINGGAYDRSHYLTSEAESKEKS